MSYGANAYANIALVPPSALHKRSAVEIRTAAVEARDSEAALKFKIEQANTILDALEARVERQTAAGKELAKRKAATLARIARIEDEILTRMSEASLDKITGIRCIMRAQAAAAALEVIDASLIPAQFMTQPKPPPPAPDKVAIKKYLAQNDELDPRAMGVKLSNKISLIRK